MKKLLLVLAIGAFVACNDSGNTEEGTSPDSPKVETPAPTPAPDSTTVVDTTKTADTTVKK